MTKKTAKAIIKPWDRGGWVLVGVILVCGLIMVYCAYIFVSTPFRSRSIYGGGPDISMVNVQCQGVTIAGDGSEIGDAIPKNTCYVNFGKDGGLLLEPEWADRFQADTAYNIFVTNRPGRGIDKVISWEVRS